LRKTSDLIEERTNVLYSSLMQFVPPQDLRLAFVDLETTGTSAISDRITEAGLVLVDADGVEEWSTLVNPQSHISSFIESLTGISNAMVADAPTFGSLAAEIHARLAKRIFVAHNARFDYAFLKNEFRRVGLDFAPDVLCTVKLSRKLFPGFARHNLDALIERHKLQVTQRHRALGDARLIWQFWQQLLASVESTLLGQTVRKLTARPALPSHLDSAIIDALPETHGVYLFYGENDLPLYIGKANNMRRRVLSHFSGDHTASKAMNLSQQLRRVDWITTTGELGALLLEASLVRKLTPILNKQLRDQGAVCAWRLIDHPQGLRLQLASSDDLFFGRDEQLFGLFNSARQANLTLRALADAHQLCPALLGLEKARPGKPCFASQVKRCSGACTGRESLAEHNARLVVALQNMRLAPWPYAGPIAIREGDGLHLVDGWSYLGSASKEEELWPILQDRRGVFQRDTYVLLQKRLAGLRSRIIELESQRTPQT